MTERQADRWSAWAVLAWALVAFWAAHPRAVGLFSDDGIYLSTARSLAETGEYRLRSVPGAPAQTKYPPLWPAMLAIAWRLAPDPAAAARAAQGLAIALTALSWWLFRRVATRTLGVSPGASLALVALLVASPMLFIGACWPLSEPLFGCLSALALLAAPRSWGAPGAPGASTGASSAGIFAAAAFLTRIQGVALIAALVAAKARERRWRAAALIGLPGAVAIGGWLAWTLVHRFAAPPLLSYYTSYRQAAVQWLARGFGVVARDFLFEVARTVEHFGALLLCMRGAGAWLLGTVVAVLAGFGAARLLREGRREALLWLAAGLGLAALHPDPAARFLSPLLPVLLGVAARAELPRRVARFGARGLALAVALSGLLRIGIELAARDPALLPDPLTLSSQRSALASFEATAAFLRAQVARGEGVAAANDLWIHLATERETLRFWLYRPRELAYARRGAPPPWVGDAREILADLGALGVGWLVLEPGSVDRFIEGPAILRLGRELVALPEAGAELRFVSNDRAHEVFRLHLARTGDRTR